MRAVPVSKTRRWLAVLLLPAIFASACSEAKDESKPASDASAKPGTPNGKQDYELPTATECKADLIACAKFSTLEPHVPDAPKVAAGEPIKIGMINQETAALGAFPELTKTAQAGTKFINKYLNGVDGRPLELTTCDLVNPLDAQGSLGCAQQMIDEGVVAVLGGIDLSGEGIQTLSDNGIPYVGGIPVSSAAGRAELSFQFSGGTWGALVAYLKHAADNDAKNVSIVYMDYGVIGEADEVANKAADQLGINVNLFSYGIGAMFDLAPIINGALETGPDAIVILAADAGCPAAFSSVEQSATKIPVYLIGACASPKILEAAGDTVIGKIFSIESKLEESEPDLVFFTGMLAEFDPSVDAVGVSTVEIRSLFNLYSIMRQVGGENIDSKSIVTALRATKNEPSFMGHPYTCDGKQFPELPAFCAPQQMLITTSSVGSFQRITDEWVDVLAVLNGE